MAVIFISSFNADNRKGYLFLIKGEKKKKKEKTRQLIIVYLSNFNTE